MTQKFKTGEKHYEQSTIDRSSCKESKLSKKDAANAVSAAIETIKKNVKKGVTLVGFGTFKIVKRKARTGRNPQTGEKIRIKAKNVVKFKPGKWS